jgi:hypothetical protein
VVAAPAASAPTTNQQIADAIALQLRQSGRLHGYHIDVSFAGGTAELTGQVADQGQREEALRLAQAVPGVEQVRGQLVLAGQAMVKQTQAVVEQPGPPLPPGPVQPPGPPLPPGPPQPVGPPQPPLPPGLMPGKDGLPPLAGGGPAPGEPTPIFHAGPPQAGPVPSLPPLPPYAWPTYAPYNNYSRVAMPLIYPYQSWPFIGPCYPFPKIPLGWRSVKLTWEDGHWWYARVATGHDWWRLRYW